MQNSIRVRIPQVVDVGEAILLYYSKTELSSADIKKLFGNKGDSTINKLKNLAKREMADNNVESFDRSSVNTKIAFRVWGINIEELETSFKKISKIRSMM